MNGGGGEGGCGWVTRREAVRGYICMYVEGRCECGGKGKKGRGRREGGGGLRGGGVSHCLDTTATYIFPIVRDFGEVLIKSKYARTIKKKRCFVLCLFFVSLSHTSSA